MWTFRYVIIVIRKAVSVMNSINKCKVTRRTFIKIGGAITAAAICGCGFELKNLYTIDDDINPDPNVGEAGVQVIRTAGMMCNAGWGLVIKSINGGKILAAISVRVKVKAGKPDSSKRAYENLMTEDSNYAY